MPAKKRKPISPISPKKLGGWTAKHLKTEYQVREFVRAVVKYSPNPYLFVEAFLEEYRKLWDKSRVEKYLERLFTRKPSLPSKVAAFYVIYYLKVDYRMFPYLVKLAKKVRERVRKRLERKNKNS